MSDLQNKYQIGVRRFRINWIGLYSLYCKETLRFLSVFGQTIIGPIITSILFLVVISLAIGNNRENVLGVEFIMFLSPGLIAMQVITQSFAHTSSSILMGKVMGNIVDMIGAPLSATEVISSIVFASVTRALIICSLSILIFWLIVDIRVQNFFVLAMYLILTSIILSCAGIIAGLWAEKFDHIATITNFLIVPLSFLSGTFYSVDNLPNILKSISNYNPFFHMIDGFRYAFILNMDGSIKFGIIYLLVLSVLFWLTAHFLYKKGYKIKS